MGQENLVVTELSLGNRGQAFRLLTPTSVL